MKILEDNLELLDIYFSKRKEIERWLIIIGMTGSIVYFTTIFFLAPAKDKFNANHLTIQELEKKEKKNYDYLSSISISGSKKLYINNFDKNIKTKQSNIKQLQNKTDFLEASLLKLSDMLFNQKSWANFLNSITKKAEKQNIKITNLRNKYLDNKGSFGYVLEIEINCKGSYMDLVSFINQLEQSLLVTDVYATDLHKDTNTSKIYADINISVWGINH